MVDCWQWCFAPAASHLQLSTKWYKDKKKMAKARLCFLDLA